MKLKKHDRRHIRYYIIQHKQSPYKRESFPPTSFSPCVGGGRRSFCCIFWRFQEGLEEIPFAREIRVFHLFICNLGKLSLSLSSSLAYANAAVMMTMLCVLTQCIWPLFLFTCVFLVVKETRQPHLPSWLLSDDLSRSSSIGKCNLKFRLCAGIVYISVILSRVCGTLTHLAIRLLVNWIGN